MKRTLVFMLSLLVFAACATTTAPSVSGVITGIHGQTLTITPSGGGEPANVTIGYSTQVVQPNGLQATGTSVLSVGMPVKVWLENGQTAGRIEVGQ